MTLCRSNGNRIRPPGQTRRGASGGFTLIETTLALALTAVGLVALLGLIPHGLDVMKTASNKSIEARIAQELVGEIMLTDWPEIDNYNRPGNDIRYFDLDGVEIEESADDFEILLNYVAKIEIPDAIGGSSGGFRLPGREEADDDVKRVVIRVANVPFKDIDFDDERYRDRINVYTSTVANMVRNRDLR